MKKLTGFTLMEILTAIIIVGTLSSLSLVSYQKVMETNNGRICKQNQAVLTAAVEIYTLEGNSLPITLSRLTDRQIHLAYEKIIGPENKFLTLAKNIIGTRLAIAGGFAQKYYGDRKVLHCPADKSAQEISYNANTIFNSLDSLSTYTAQALFYDKDTYHKKGIINPQNHANGINPDGITDEIISLSEPKVTKVKNFIASFGGDITQTDLIAKINNTGTTKEDKEIAKIILNGQKKRGADITIPAETTGALPLQLQPFYAGTIESMSIDSDKHCPDTKSNPDHNRCYKCEAQGGASCKKSNGTALTETGWFNADGMIDDSLSIIIVCPAGYDLTTTNNKYYCDPI